MGATAEVDCGGGVRQVIDVETLTGKRIENALESIAGNLVGITTSLQGIGYELNAMNATLKKKSSNKGGGFFSINM